MSIISAIGIFVLGMVTTFWINLIRTTILNKRNQVKLNKPFEDLLDSFQENKLIFERRVNNIITFILSPEFQNKKEPRFSASFTLDKGLISIFKGDDCIAISSSIDRTIVDSLFAEMREFSTEYNDITMYGEYVISKNMVDKDKTKKNKAKSFNMDDILDKINKIGFDKLSEDEKNFLNNLGKK
jgi:hypothetical protein